MTEKCQHVGNAIEDLGKRLELDRKENQADPLVHCQKCQTVIGRQSHCGVLRLCGKCSGIERDRIEQRRRSLAAIPPRYRQAEMSASLCERLIACLPSGPGPHVLTLAGPPNVGKTWNACGLWRYCVEQGIAVTFWLVSDLMIYLAGLWRDQDCQPYEQIKALEEFDGLLILDDLGKESPSDAAIRNLFAIIYHRLMFDRPTLITTNLPWTAKQGIDSVESVYGKAWLWRLQPGYIAMTERK